MNASQDIVVLKITMSDACTKNDFQEDGDDEDEDANQWLDILEDFIDGVWIFKKKLGCKQQQRQQKMLKGELKLKLNWK
nr:hypothetical protein [Tanacetum cinerariifolium]